MPSRKIAIGECNVSDLRFRPFNLIWGGPLLVKDRRRHQKRQDQQNSAQPTPVLELPPVVPVVEEAQPEASPRDEAVLPAEPDNPPVDVIDDNVAGKEEVEAIGKGKRHKKFRPRKYYDIDSDSDSDSDSSSSSSSSIGLHRSTYRRSYHRHSHLGGNHHGGYRCRHDAETEKSKPKHRRRGKTTSIKAVRCPVCRQRVSLPSAEGGSGDSDVGSNGEKSYVCKRDKKQKRPKERSATEKSGSGGYAEGQKIKDDSHQEDETQEPAAAAAPTDGEAVAEPTGQNGADEATADKNSGGHDDGDTVNVESNVIPTIQDAVRPLLGAGPRADFPAVPGVYPSPMTPSCHHSDHDMLPYRPEFAHPSSYPYPYPPYPAYHYAYPPYPIYPYSHAAPPLAGYMQQPHVPPSISPDPPAAAHAAFNADVQGHGGRSKSAVDGTNTHDDGGYNPALWHDIAPTTSSNANGVDDGDKAAATSNDQIDSWGIKWDDNANNEGGGGGASNDNWGCEQANTEHAAGQPPTWTDSDLALLGRLHAQHITDRWRDLQAAFYNETGRMVDCEVLKNTAEQGAGDANSLE